MIVWAAAMALALRCFTQSVMVGFYVWPVLAIGLVAAAHGDHWRMGAAGAAALFTTSATQWHLGWFSWWALATAGIAVVLVFGTPIGNRPTTEDTCDLSLAGRGREPPAVLIGAIR